MASGLETSSPFDSPTVDLAAKRREAPLPAANPFDASMDTALAQRKEQTALAANWAKQFQPDVYAKVKDLAGMAPEVAIRNLPEIEQAQRLTLLQDIFAASPNLQRYFADNSQNLPLAEPKELEGFWQTAQRSRAKHLQDVIAGLYGPGGPGLDDPARLRQAAQTFRSEANLYFQHDRRDALHQVARAIETGTDPSKLSQLLDSALRTPERNLAVEVAQLGIGVPRGGVATFGAGLKGQAILAEGGEAKLRSNLLATIAEGRNPALPTKADQREAYDANRKTILESLYADRDRLREQVAATGPDGIRGRALESTELQIAAYEAQEFAPTELPEEVQQQFVAARRTAAARELRNTALTQLDEPDREILFDIAARLEAGEDLEVGRLGVFNTPIAAAERSAFQFGQMFQDVAQEYFGATPGYEETFAAELGEALGSLSAFIAISASGSGPIGSFAAAGLMGISEQYERAVASGMNPQQATAVALAGAGPGAIQAISIEFLLQRLPKGAREEFNVWLRGIRDSAGAEAAVESAGMVLQNALEQTYNPEKDLMDGVVEAGMLSGTAAGALRGVLASTVPRTIERMRGLQEAATAINDAQAARRLTGDLFEEAGKNKLAERAPKEAAEMIDAMQPGQRRWVPPEAIVAFAQSEGADPYGLPLADWSNRLTEALRTGTEVELSLGEFVATFGTNPNATPLLDLTRHSPEAFTAAEIVQYREEAMAAAEGTLQKRFAGDELMPQLMEILQGSNQTTGEIATVARLMAEFYGTMSGTAAKDGVDITPEGLMNAARLMVQSMAQPDGLQTQALAEGQPATNQASGEQAGIEGQVSPNILFQQDSVLGTEFEEFFAGDWTAEQDAAEFQSEMEKLQEQEAKQQAQDSTQQPFYTEEVAQQLADSSGQVVIFKNNNAYVAFDGTPEGVIAAAMQTFEGITPADAKLEIEYKLDDGTYADPAVAQAALDMFTSSNFGKILYPAQLTPSEMLSNLAQKTADDTNKVVTVINGKIYEAGFQANVTTPEAAIAYVAENKKYGEQKKYDVKEEALKDLKFELNLFLKFEQENVQGAKIFADAIDLLNSDADIVFAIPKPKSTKKDNFGVAEPGQLQSDWSPGVVDPPKGLPKNLQEAVPAETRDPSKPWLKRPHYNTDTYPDALIQKLLTPEFETWFGVSKVTDNNDVPLMMYHGTQHQFEAFNPGYRKAIFFAANPQFANNYGGIGKGKTLVPVFLRVERPAGENKETAEALYYNLFDVSITSKMTLEEFMMLHGDFESITEATGRRYTGQQVATLQSFLTDVVISKAERPHFNSWSRAEGMNQLLREANFDGYFETENGEFNVAVFDPTQVKSLFNSGRYDRNNPDTLAQGNETVTRGMIEFTGQPIEKVNEPAPGSLYAVISLFEQSNKSTLLHEFGHYTLNVMRDLAEVSPSIAADYAKIRKHLGLADGAPILREHHEQYAKWFEAYLFTGVAPSNALVPVFRKLKKWFKEVYDKIANLGGKLDPELQQVFDRMFAAEARYYAAEAAYRPLFTEAAEMGVAPEDFFDFLNLVQTIRQDGQDRARTRIIGQGERLAKGWFKQIEGQLAREAEARLASEAPYRDADRWGPEFSMARDELLSQYNEDTVAQLPRKAVRKNGLDPALVADILGYDSLDDMIYVMTNSKPLKVAAREAAKAEMIRRYGEDFNSAEVVDLAIAQELADEGRLTVFAKELAALGRKAGRSPDENGPKLFAKQLAKQTLETKPIDQINASLYQRTAARYGKEAEKAVVAGDWAKAAEAKRKQLFAQALHNEAVVVLKDVERIRKKAARYAKTKVAGIAPDYVEQIIGIVERFEFAKRSGKQLERRERLRAFLEAAEDDGQVVQVPDYLRDDAYKVNYKKLTSGELHDVGAAIENLEHLGRRKNKFRKNKELREFEEVKTEILDQLAAMPKKPRKMRSMTEEARGIRGYASDLMAGLLKPEQIVEWLDAGELGPVSESIWMPIQRAYEEARDLEKEFNSKLKDTFLSLDPRRMREIVTIKEITDKDSSSKNFGKPIRLTYEEIFSVALNTGNKSNHAKLLEGEGWTEQQLEAVLRHLTRDDAKIIQSAWDVIGDLWPKIVALEKRLTGVAPKMVEPQPTTIGGVTLAGGYYPVVYDFRARRGMNLEVRPEPQDQQLVVTEQTGHINWKFGNLNNRPGTDHKYTETRKKVARPLKLGLNVVPTHIHKVIHDLTHREAIRDVYKLLSDPEIRRGIEDVQGFEEYNQLMHWLRSVATPETTVEPPGFWWDLVKRARLNSTLVGLGFSFTAAISQPFGVFPAAQKMGSRWMLAGIQKMAAHPGNMNALIMSKSGEMRHRFNNNDRDLADTVNNWKYHDSFINKVRLSAFIFISGTDKYTAGAVWLGAYAKQIAANPGNDDAAVQYADRMVRLTQGTGSIKDMARVQTLPGFKMFTLFYSFFSAQHNMQVDLYRKTKRDIVAGDWKSTAVDLGRWMNLVVVPAILSAVFMGQGPDEDDMETPEALAMWMALTSVGFAAAGVPIVRDAANSLITGFDYAATPLQRVPESIIKVAKDLDRAATDELQPRRITMNSLMAFGYLAGVPVSQPRKTLDGIWGGLENNDFEIQDALFGRRGRP